MWFSVSEHFRVMLYSVVMGVIFGILYDLIKISRAAIGVASYSGLSKQFYNKRVPGSVISFTVMLVGDLLFAVLCGMIYSLFLFHAIRGQVRWYFLLSSALGFFAYYFTVSRFVMIITESLIFAIKSIIKTLFIPVRFLLKLVLKIFTLIKQKIILKMVDDLVYNKRVKYTISNMKSIGDKIRFENN